ncbi:MAG: diacylglycerol kinase family protein [Rikenellaceae bacterium]
MSLQSRWFLLLNPTADRGRSLHDYPAISRLLREANVAFEPAFAEHKSHAVELTVKAVNEGYRKIIIIGGDGTLHEVVNGLFIQQSCQPNEVLLALIAVKSESDWLRSYGTPASYQEAVAAIAAGCSMLQDVGVVSYQESHYKQKRYMANVAGVGFGAFVTQRFSHLRNKGATHPWRYGWNLVRAFFRYKPTGVKVWLDGELIYNNLLMGMAVGVCKYNGRGMQLLPDAIADDGLLDLSLVRPIYIWNILFRLRYLFDGNVYKIGHVIKARGHNVRIESIPDAPLEVDGEMIGDTPLEFNILPRAIQVVVSQEFYHDNSQLRSL